MSRSMLATVCLALAAGALGCSGVKPGIEPQADAVLRRMSDTLAKAQSFKLHSTATVEERLDSGQLAQFTRNSTITVSRPDCMYADVCRGPECHKVWYQGKELTVLDVRRGLYATVQAPGRIDQMLDFLAEKHGAVIPLDDLLYPNPYQVLTERVTSGTYVDQQEIAGRTCDHLMFKQDNVNWQIWIDAGEVAVPRKIVITYKDDPDHPQYEAVLDEWQLALPADPKLFAPAIPSSARHVEFAQLLDAE